MAGEDANGKLLNSRGTGVFGVGVIAPRSKVETLRAELRRLPEF